MPEALKVEVFNKKVKVDFLSIIASYNIPCHGQKIQTKSNRRPSESMTGLCDWM